MHGLVLPSKPRSSDTTWVTRLWPGVKSSDITQEHYTDYLDFTDAEIRIFKSVCPEPSPFKDFSDVLRLISLFQQEVNLTRQRAEELATPILPPGGCDASAQNADVVWRCVELAVRLWSTLNIRVPFDASCAPTSRATPAVFPGQESYIWVDDSPLQEFILGNFKSRGSGQPQIIPSSSAPRLVPSCTMAYLAQAYDIRPHWTSNLADHLKFEADSRTITVYEHKIFLWNHLRSKKPRNDRNGPPILPWSVVNEAMDTLNLLFPFGDDATEALLRREGKDASFYRLGSCKGDRQFEMSRYEYWRDELEEIAAVVSQPPRGRAQFLLDREGTNSRDVWTFWTAMGFGALALIGVGSGMYSAVYARAAYDVGLLQYQLALAQACSAENATDVLPAFCS